MRSQSVFKLIPFLLLFAALAPSAARAESSIDGGVEIQLGRGFGTSFDHLQGSLGLGLRLNRQMTFRVRWNHLGHGDADPPYRTGTSFTGGVVLHPFEFVGKNVKSSMSPYIALDVGPGFLYGGSDNMFFHLDALGGLNIDVSDHWTVFVEGGYLRIDYDDDGQAFGRAGGINQALLGAGVRFFL